MALFGALCVTLNALSVTNRILRALVSRLLGEAYTVNQMSYDLGRLRLTCPRLARVPPRPGRYRSRLGR